MNSSSIVDSRGVAAQLRLGRISTHTSLAMGLSRVEGEWPVTGFTVLPGMAAF